MEQTSERARTKLNLPGWLTTILQVYLAAVLPLLLVLINARLLMSGAFLRWEYNRPWLPDDPFGFTREDRLEYAPPALAYLFNDEEIDFLGDTAFPNGDPLYNERELSHMADVKVVTKGLSRFGYSAIGIWIVCGALLYLSDRQKLRTGLLSGSLLTAGLIVVGLIAVATSFNWLFTQFHALFFTGDTWLFPTSDTLIRLFPERFWTDAFALMFGGALLEAAVLGGVMWRLEKKKGRSE